MYRARSFPVAKWMRHEFMRVARWERGTERSKLVPGAYIWNGNYVKQNEVQWITFPDRV